MTLPIPLTVRLANSDVDRHITKDLRNLSFRSAAEGGFASATFSLDRPLSITSPELAYYTKVYIYDGRTGQIEWNGRLEDPGRSATADGLVWDLAAVGPSAFAKDRAIARVYVDSSTERWLRGPLSDVGGQVHGSNLGSDNETPSILLVFQEGMSLTNLSNVDIEYRTLYDCGQQVARIRTDYQNAITNSTVLRNRLLTRTGPTGTGTAVNDDDWSSGGSSFNAARGSAVNPIPAGDDIANIRIMRYSGSETATALRWGEFWGMSVRAMLKDINGNDLVTSGGDTYYTNVYVTAAEVVTDLIGRGDMAFADPATSTVDTSGTAQIDQLAFPTGITPAEILDALVEFEPAFYWAAWEQQANGKYRFEWTPWPTTARYIISVRDGFDSTGSAAEQANEAIVSYRDWRNRERTTVRTSSVPELTAAGITRTIQVDLGGELNSLANAQRAGDQALALHATPSTAGRLTVARPVLNRDTGIMEAPWEIRPGRLVTLQEAGTTHRILAVDYDVSSAAATLELDTTPPSIAAALAKIEKKRSRRR